MPLDPELATSPFQGAETKNVTGDKPPPPPVNNEANELALMKEYLVKLKTHQKSTSSPWSLNFFGSFATKPALPVAYAQLPTVGKIQAYGVSYPVSELKKQCTTTHWQQQCNDGAIKRLFEKMSVESDENNIGDKITTYKVRFAKTSPESEMNPSMAFDLLFIMQLDSIAKQPKKVRALLDSAFAEPVAAEDSGALCTEQERRTMIEALMAFQKKQDEFKRSADPSSATFSQKLPERVELANNAAIEKNEPTASLIEGWEQAINFADPDVPEETVSCRSSCPIM